MYEIYLTLSWKNYDSLGSVTIKMLLCKVYSFPFYFWCPYNEKGNDGLKSNQFGKKKKHIASCYIKKLLSISSISLLNKREKTTPIY